LDIGEVTRLAPEWDRTLRELLHGTTLTVDDAIRSLGRSFHIGVVDGEMRFDFDHSVMGRELPGFRRNPFESLVFGFCLSALNLPIYAAIEVRDEETVLRFVREWLTFHTDENLRKQDLWNRSFFDFKTYETQAGEGRPTIHGLDLLLFILRYRFFFAVHQGHLLIATQRELLNELLDANLPRFRTRANIEMRLRYEAFDRVALTTKLNWQAQTRQACQNNLGLLYQLARYRRLPPGQWSSESLRVNGFIPFCPEGGTYQDEIERNCISCSIHGDHIAPRQPWKANANQPLNRFLDSLKELGGSLSFTPEGIMTRVFIRR
ncbi:MAG TPA: hypothetical protein PKO06_19430, partial [Candidatus Ozemobacteraceae bacterium]|nr:hypothetical protein [Candidatus Ozemobacteraceae bacterium]